MEDQEKTFIVKHYSITSPKIQRNTRVLFLSDLHSYVHGHDNEELLERCITLCPDIVIMGGDMISSMPLTHEISLRVAEDLSIFSHVYYVDGNHETTYRVRDLSGYNAYMKKLQELGVVLIHNLSSELIVNETRFLISGYEFPLSTYKRCINPEYPVSELERKLQRDETAYQILAAHNPYFKKLYKDWGADLTLCGHYHGGIIKLWNKPLLSPYGTFFPKQVYGHYLFNEKHLIITSGIGEHVRIKRINNPMEIVCIDLFPEGLIVNPHMTKVTSF